MTVTIDIPEKAIGSLIDLNALRHEIFEDFVLAQRHKGEISLQEASELLGVTRREAMEMLGRRGLPFSNVPPGETTAGLDALRRKAV